MEHRATRLRQHRQAHIVKPQTTAYLDEDIVDTLEAIDRLGDFGKIVASSMSLRLRRLFLRLN